MIEKFIQSGIVDASHINTLAQYAKENDKRLVYLDATFVLPTSTEDIKHNFLTKRVENSISFDIKLISNSDTSLPHMLPSQDKFSKSLSHMGIKNDDIIIIYAQHSMIMGPARAWWMLKGFGHKNIMVFNGNLSSWENFGHSVETGLPKQQEQTDYVAQEFKSSMISDMSSLIKTSENNTHPIIDARPVKRFQGILPEPRKNMRSGHIPNSKSLPCTSIITEKGLFKNNVELETMFQSIGIDVKHTNIEKITTTCGSGITACALSLALYHIGYKGHVSVYDGSWSEWGLDTSPTIVET